MLLFFCFFVSALSILSFRTFFQHVADYKIYHTCTTCLFLYEQDQMCLFNLCALSKKSSYFLIPTLNLNYADCILCILIVCKVRLIG